MHKGDIIEGTIQEVRYPNKGLLRIGEGPSCVEITVKNTLPGQRVRARVTKKHAGRAEAALLEILSPSPLERTTLCPKFGVCGGCQYLSLPEEEELRIKEEQVRNLLRGADPDADSWFEGILQSPVTEGYRNKMELTFGDEEKGGPLTLGMHCRGSFYDVTDADACRIVDADFRAVIRAARDYWAAAGVPFYHRLRREGYLRHLLIRKGMKTGEILIDLVTTGQTGCLPFFSGKKNTTGRPADVDPKRVSPTPSGDNAAGADSDSGFFAPASQSSGEEAGAEEGSARERELLTGFAAALRSLDLDGNICGILHTRNDSIADIVEDQGTEILFGRGSFEEELLGLRFTVTPFSFFQTNSAGAELLYETARTFVRETQAAGAEGAALLPPDPDGSSGSARVLPAGNAAQTEREAGRGNVVFDLYCGTGTISLLMAPAAERVIGVEIVEEAVSAARENAARCGITNCTFIAGDVLEVLDSIEEKPDLIILDPPRDGVHPKALPKILRYGVPYILYISCKPTSLARDLPVMRAAGYRPVRGVSINQFPRTGGIETIALMRHEKPQPDACVDLIMDMKDDH